jgi:thymidine phosphorylase
LIEQVGCCIVGQTLELNPADRVLYATRDVTGTVDCIPLIAGSIVSKKAIEDLDALVLDVKIGKAAFMKNQEDAELLADYMLKISKKLGLKAGVFLTRHDNPLGYAVGNQIEIEETIECLHGNMRPDIQELVTMYGGYLLHRTKKAKSMSEGVEQILRTLQNGQALQKFYEMIKAQGVDERVAEELCFKRNYDAVFGKKALFTSLIKATKCGFIKSINAIELGLTATKLGSGRAKAGDKISFEVGIRILKKIGDYAQKDEPLLQVYHNSLDFETNHAPSLVNSIQIEDESIVLESLIIKIIDFE